MPLPSAMPDTAPERTPMSLKKLCLTSMLYTLVTAVILGLIYPTFITLVAHGIFPKQADGQLIARNGQTVGSRLIGQPFTGPGFFHSRPSAAGAGYDASSSSGSNLGPASKALQDRVAASVKAEQATASTEPVPIDLVTASGSGLDPDISVAAALYQVDRVARERKVAPAAVAELVKRDTTPRQFGLLGEPRVNVLALNLDLAHLPH